VIDLARAKQAIHDGARPFWRGRVDRVSGVMVEALGAPAAIGEMCRIELHGRKSVLAEVVGFRGPTTLLMPHGELAGIAPKQAVVALGRHFSVPVGEDLFGRVVDGFGEALDGGAPIATRELRGVRSAAPDPMSRPTIDEPLATGVRAIDGLCLLGRGQRLGIFSGTGVGKTSLLAQISRGTDADAIVVCLVGERGREVKSFVDEVLDTETRKKSVVVVATSDRPPIERFMAPFVAVTIAEALRDRGRNVLLVMDSVTRFAAASREIGLAAGEPPTVRGYPPSFFATVPKLVERMGRTVKGSITGILTVLLDQDDPNDPVSDTLRGLLDGHVYLTRELASRGHYPAIDVLQSLSRLMHGLAGTAQENDARKLRELLAVHREGRDLIDIGAYKAGSNPRLDQAVSLLPAIEAFLRQRVDELTPLADTQGMLAMIAARTGGRA
jgi:flagellum-specific ATP synthase/type III secretion protein N (ATPase)